ncbi:MAG: phenylalanine--tRNA ligase subunit alpha, partial [Gemmatimonadetes bacterium]|nr:phenylalanine--tRNA ligase subunit alpha [Gemmatimonadota bacterium]
MPIERIRDLSEEFEEAIAVATDADSVEALRIGLLGRKGALKEILRTLGQLPPEERKSVGRLANELRARIESRIAEAKQELAKPTAEEAGPDLTLPGRAPWRGGLHPVRLVERRLVEIFRGMGFDVALGPDIELDYFNFKALNFPDDHPARDMHDTFYVGGEVLLRTHTSPVQIRTMEGMRPPVRVVTPGRVYRSETI